MEDFETQGIDLETADNTGDAATPEGELTPEKIDGEQPAESAPTHRKNGVQERFDELTREKYELKAEKEYAFQRAQQLEAELMRLKAPIAPPQPETPPEASKFDNYDDYIKATAAYEARQIVAREISIREQARQREQVSERFYSTLEQQRQKGQAKYQDFDAVALAPDVPWSEFTANAVVFSEAGADMAYYLGKNKDVAHRLANMHPIQAALEIGKLEERIKSAGTPPPVSRISKAPEPINPLSGGAAGTGRDPSEMSPAEFAKWRSKHIQKRR